LELDSVNAMASDLDELVESTRGLQPFRRLFHMSMGLSFAGILWALRPTRPERLLAIAALAGLVAILFLVDIVRLWIPGLNVLFFRTLRSLASPREAKGIASSTWYVVGILIALILYPIEIVVPAILVLALADPAANYFGRRWGRRRLGKGTIEGVAVFVLVAAAVLWFWAPPATALACAVVGALVEVAPWWGRVDDNLTIPLAVATALWVLPT
jgi:dolichol kinase